MPIVSLIAAPGKLEPAALEAVRGAWGGGAARWLSGGEAAEFAVPDVPRTSRGSAARWMAWESI